MAITRAAATFLLVFSSARASAQNQPPAARAEVTIGSTTGSSVRSYGADWLVSPFRELEIGASFRFLTAPESALTDDDDGELRFTDVGIFRTSARFSTATKLEIAAGVDLLAKQPSYLDESPFYGADAGLRYALGERWAAWLRGAGGPLLGNLGAWGEVGAGLQARRSIHQTIRFQAALGAAGTRLFMGEDSGRPWFTELVSHGEAVLRAPRGEVAGWFGIDYRVPLAHADWDYPMDPQVRLNFQMGMMLGFVAKWDLYLIYAIVDRGDVEDPATTLPLLDGGFDQSQLVFGAARHFDLSSAEEKQEILQIVGR